MKNSFLVCAIFFEFLTHLAHASDTSFADCKGSWLKLKPEVSYPTHNDNSYEQMALKEDATYLEKRVAKFERLTTPNWDFAWLKDPKDQALLAKQNQDILNLVHEAKNGIHVADNIRSISSFLLSPHSDAIQSVAVNALAEIGNPAAASALMDVTHPFSSTALACLDYSRDQNIGEVVRNFLVDASFKPNSDQSNWLALSYMKSEKILPLLEEKMLSDSDSWNALRGYVNFKDVRAVSTFLKIAKTPKSESQLSNAILGLTYFAQIGLLTAEKRMDAFSLATNSYLDNYGPLNGEPLINLVNLAPKECK